MINEHGKSVITVKKSELMTKMQKNREGHRALFLEAQQGFRITVIEELDKMLAEARAGKAYRTYVHLDEPQDHTKDYDRVISMLEMSVHDDIMISETEFSQYVLDEWGWKAQFDTVNSSYTGKVR